MEIMDYVFDRVLGKLVASERYPEHAEASQPRVILSRSSNQSMRLESFTFVA